MTPCNRSGKILPDSDFFEFEKSWQWITCTTFTWHYYIHELSKEGGRKLGKKKTVSGGKESKFGLGSQVAVVKIFFWKLKKIKTKASEINPF